MSDDAAKHSTPALSLVQAARLLGVVDAARAATQHVLSEQGTAHAALEKQQHELEAVQESGQRLSARGRDIRNSLQQLRESVDRAKLTALNAGLEGARMGDPVGKALVIMGDDVRQLLARALEALEEHAALLADVDRERERCLTDLNQLHHDARQTVKGVARSQEQGKLASALLGELRTDLGELLGADPDATRVLSEAAIQVERTARSLRELGERAPLGPDALRELFGPLLALIPPGAGGPR